MSSTFFRRLALAFIIGMAVAAYGKPSFLILTSVGAGTVLWIVLAPPRWQVYGMVTILAVAGGFWFTAHEASWQMAVQQAQDLSSTELFQARLEATSAPGIARAKLTEPKILRGRNLNIRLPKNSVVTEGERRQFRCQIIIPATNNSFSKSRNEIGLCAKPELLQQHSPTISAQWRGQLRTIITAHIDQLFDQPTAGFFRALLLGDTTALAPGVSETFRLTGTSHVIAISGLHFALLGIMISILLELLLLRPPARFFVLMVLFAGYVWLVGPAPSVVRGAVFALAIAAAYMLGRSWQAWHMLVLTAFGFLLLDPLAMYNISFLLSFSATAGMILIAPLIEIVLQRIPGVWPTVTHTTAAMLGPVLATGPVLLLFTSVPLIAPLANILVVPLSAALMGLGIIAVAGSFFLGPMAEILANVLHNVFMGIMLVLEQTAHVLPVISQRSSHVWQGLWLMLVGLCFYLGTRALAPKRLLFYTVGNENRNQNSVKPFVDRG